MFSRAAHMVLITVALSLQADAQVLEKPADTNLPKIRVLATGGTIAGAQSDKQQSGYKAGAFKLDDLIDAVPELKQIAEISGEQVANIGSQTMNNEVWLKLSKRVNDVLKVKENYHPLDIVYRLAADHSIVLLNGADSTRRIGPSESPSRTSPLMLMKTSAARCGL
jgi:hypothetical protein